jgi:hypothetical protein
MKKEFFVFTPHFMNVKLTKNEVRDSKSVHIPTVCGYAPCGLKNVVAIDKDPV